MLIDVQRYMTVPGFARIYHRFAVDPTDRNRKGVERAIELIQQADISKRLASVLRLEAKRNRNRECLIEAAFHFTKAKFFERKILRM